MKKEFNFKFLNKIMYVAAFIVLFYVLQNIGILNKLAEINTSLIPVYIGIVICFLSMPLAKKLRKAGIGKGLAAVISLAIIYLVIGIVFAMVIPVFIEQLTKLISNFPELYTSITTNLNIFISENFGNLGESIKLNTDFVGFDMISSYVTDIISFSITTVQSMFSFVIAIFTTIIVSFFLVKDMEDIKKVLVNMFSSGGRNKAREKLINEIETAIMSYVKGVSIDSVIVGILTAIVCMILKLDYAIVFGILITVLNFIPYIGALLSEVIIALYALTVGGPMFAILTFLLLVVIQIIDANILQPNIVGKSVSLHPVIIFVGLLVGNILMGIFGMIIVIPVCAVIKIIIQYKIKKNNYHLQYEPVEEDQIQMNMEKK